jgi:hypothetical protein
MKRTFARSLGLVAILGGAIPFAIGTVASTPARAELVPDQFRIRSAQDLVDLCGADVKDLLYDDAVNFCHGFVAGAWQYHEAQANGPDGHRIVCPTDPLPTRSDAVTMFLAWSETNGQHLTEPPVEALFRFLHEKWPCPTKAATEKGAAK